ncbi:MAG: Primosomal replication protein [Pseudomonadota bacterium]
MPLDAAAAKDDLPGENRLILSGAVIECSALRRTPAGVAVQGFKLLHQSRQMENGLARDVTVELEAIAVGSLALVAKAAQMGSKVRLEGFLAQKSLRNGRPVLHVEKIEFLEG